MSTVVEVEPDAGAARAPGAPARRTWPLTLALFLAVAFIAGVGWTRVFPPDPLELGDRGTATAAVQEDCQSLSIDLDGLTLSGRAPIPETWRGRSVEGTVTLDERTGEHSVSGLFTSADGTTVAVHGGESGKVFFTLACRTWD